MDEQLSTQAPPSREGPAQPSAQKPGLTARRLPPEDWARTLAGTPIEKMLPALNPEYTVLIVVEDAAGAVVGHWTAINVVHLEGVWVHEAHRKQAGVARALLDTMARELATYGVPEALTSAETPEVEQLIVGLGGRRIPGSQWVLTVGDLVARTDPEHGGQGG